MISLLQVSHRHVHSHTSLSLSWNAIQFNGASLVDQLAKNPPAMQETWFNSWVRKTTWSMDRLPTPVFLGFPGGSDSKESACNAGNLGSIPGLGRSLGGGIATHSSILAWRIPMDRGAWRATVHGVTKSWTERLSTYRIRSEVKVTQSCPTLRPHALYHPWNSPGQNIEVGGLSLLQGIFQPRD